MRIAIISITESGEIMSEALSLWFKKEKIHSCNIYKIREKGALKEVVNKIFNEYDGLIFFMAIGIVVRIIAVYLKDKHSDPAIVVVDDSCRYAVSLLSGHEGGANKLAFDVARILGAEPVITTASDANRKIILGIGCRRGVSEGEIIYAVKNILKDSSLTLNEIRLAASVELKRNETGLINAFSKLNIPLIFISREHILSLKGAFNFSFVVMRNIGIPGVAEPCALLGGRETELILPKTKCGPVTIALARENIKLHTA